MGALLLKFLMRTGPGGAGAPSNGIGNSSGISTRPPPPPILSKLQLCYMGGESILQTRVGIFGWYQRVSQGIGWGLIPSPGLAHLPSFGLASTCTSTI